MESAQLAQTILAATRNPSCAELRLDLLEAAVRYARLRAEWALAPVDGRGALDPARSRAHDVLIDAFNILSRCMARHGGDNSWREALGDERGAIGDVACHMQCLLALSAR